MAITRRGVMTGMAALSLTHPAWAQTGFSAWLSGFRTRARAAGIKATTLDNTLGSITYLPKVVQLDHKQAETARSLQDYISTAASSGRISGGTSALRKYKTLLGKIEKRFGVPKEIVTAIWGMESSFGGFRGTQPVLSVLATLAFDGRRAAQFETELIAALRIQQQGDITANRMVGSHAGAMGHTQFMPSTYQAHAVDWDGNGRRNIWSDDPSDALASTAAYLKSLGWKKGQPWGIEVTLPNGFDPALSGRVHKRSRQDWAKLGLRTARGAKLPDHGKGGLILPAGPRGPAFLIYGNFQVLKGYNYADSYVLGVGHLADRLAGGAPIRSGYPQDPWGMTTSERQNLQRGLNDAGFNAGRPDGVIGEKGRAAIRAWEKANGRRETGVPSRRLLEAVR